MGNILNRQRRVAIYGRVSTEHEAQVNAMENQKAWYEGIAQQHPEWSIVGRYFDEGITGTAAQKRPAFMQMLEDARLRKFDLLITREVCRFARNVVDTLSITRELAQINVEVYFIQDNIRTMDGDGELRLSLMATLAQEESRKISERVLAGQKISRQKGVLYGTGNILGYDRVNGTYVINPEQAYVVRKIFELYAAGMGYSKICAELIRLGCKNAHGDVKWTMERIGRILRNATYKGYIGYNKSHSDGYLSQKRVNHRDEAFEYIKGNFEPIVSEELWNRCEEIRLQKGVKLLDSNGATRKFGRKEPQSIWTSKLRCSCGSAFRRFLWHSNQNGKKTYGYECYRQKREVSRRYLEAHGLDTSQICTSKSIPYWHIDLMAQKVFQAVWKDRKDAVLLACQMIEECAVQQSSQSSAVLDGLQSRADKLKVRLKRLREIYADGDISREEFLSDSQQFHDELEHLEQQIQDLSNRDTAADPIIDLEKIQSILNQWIDLSAPVIPDDLIDQFILQVVVVDDNTFNWTLDFSMDIPEAVRNLPPSEIARQSYHAQRTDTPIDSVLNRHITNPQPLFTFTITEQEAREYCQSIGTKFFAKKWQDKTVIISI